MGIAAIMPLAQGLQGAGFTVKCLACFNPDNAHAWQQADLLAKQADVLIGWSMGGQLAALLAQQCLLQSGRAHILISLASNPQFVASSDWPCAIPASTMQQFQSDFQQSVVATQNRFCYMATLGDAAAKMAWKRLMQCLTHQEPSNNQDDLAAQLAQLARLNVRDVLQNYTGPQYHLFAQQDALVSHQVAQQLQQISARRLQVDVIANASHAFVYLQATETLQKLLAILNAAD